MKRESFEKTCIFFSSLILGVDVLTVKAPCEKGLSWWNARNGSCINCTICDTSKHLTVLRPCVLHQDTLCISLHMLDIDWPAPRLSNNKNYSMKLYSKFRAKLRINHDLNQTSDYFEYDDNGELMVEELSTETQVYWDMFDVQSVFLLLAATGCIFFFMMFIVMYLIYKHQWRKKLKPILERDIQEMTARLVLMRNMQSPKICPRCCKTQHIYANIGQNDHKNGRII